MAEQIVQQTGDDILDAVQSGDVTTVEKYLEEGVPVDLTDEAGWSLLHHAAALGQVEVITLLHEKGCRVDPVDNEGRTPLHYAATTGDIETIRLLTAMGSNVNTVDNDGNTPLQWSVMCEQYIAIEELIKYGGTVDNEEPEPPTECVRKPVVIYHIQGSGELVPEEIYPGNQIKLTNGTVIHNVGSHTELIFSDNHGSSDNHQTYPITTQPSKDTTADTTKQPTKDIFEAAQCGDTNTVKEYLDLGVPVDVTDEDGWSPVHHALAYRQVEMIRLLMDRGCLMNPVQKKKTAPQHRGGLHTTTERGSKNSTLNENRQCDNDVFEAARCGDTDKVKACLDLGIPVDLTDEDGRTILHCAAGEGQIKVVELLIERGCRIDLVDTNGWTPLDYASMCGRKETVRLLKQFGENPHKKHYITGTKVSEDENELFIAAASGHIDVIEHLAGQGLNVNTMDNAGRTPLHYAGHKGQFESVRTLLRLGGRKSMTKVAGRLGTPLHQAVGQGHKDIVSLLLNEGCSSNLVDGIGRSLVHFAVAYGHIDILQMLVKHGGDFNMSDNEDQTPLHYAARRGQFESARTLLRLGVRKSMTKVAGRFGTPLHKAIAEGHKDIVSLLLNEGYPIDVVDSEGGSLIHFVAQCGRIDILEMLASQGLDLNIGDNRGWTPLHYAAGSGQHELVYALLTLGARESMTKVAGIDGTPFHVAVREGHKDVVSLLLNEGCPVDVVNTKGETAIHTAAHANQIDMIEILANQGLDVNIVDDEGLTALHSVAVQGLLEAVCTLLRLGGQESMTKIAGSAGTPLNMAVGNGHKDIVLLLLNEGCPIDVVSDNGSTLIHTAVKFNQIDMIEMLAEQGLNVNIVDNEGLTPLHLAAAKNTKAVRTLLRLGGQESMTVVGGIAGTPLHQAAGLGHKETVLLLLNEGCPIDVVDCRGRGLLHFAAQGGQTDMIKMFAEQGLDVNLSDNDGITPLYSAAVSNQPAAVHTLLRLGGRDSMTKIAEGGGTPLHVAVGKGHKDVVSLLLDEGCPSNIVDENGIGLIHFAAQFGQIDMIKMLAGRKLDVNVVDNIGRTPLHYAVFSGQLEAVRTLLKLDGKKSMTTVSDTSGTPIHVAVKQGFKDIASLLLKEGCPIDVVDSIGNSLLHIASQYGQTELIEMLAEQELDVNITNELDYDGITPLHMAARFEQIEAVRTLLRLGAGKSMTKVAGDAGTPLHQAASNGRKDILSLLLNEGCPINVLDSSGWNILHFASQFGQVDMIKYLVVKHGMNVNKGDDHGWTPVHTAAYSGQIEVERTLLQLGGRRSMTKVAGIAGTPLHLAVEGGHKDVALFLLDEGCSVSVVNSGGRTLIHTATQFGQTDMIEMLAEKELDVNVEDNDNMTPLHIAAASGHLESVRTLLRLGGRKSMTKVAGSVGTPLHYAAVLGRSRVVSLLLNEGCRQGMGARGAFNSDNFANIRSSQNITPLMWAVNSKHITIFRELIRFGGDIRLSDDFGMNVSDWITLFQGGEMAKQFCEACGVRCDGEGLIGVLSALIANKLLDINKVLCLAAVVSKVSTFEAMVSSRYKDQINHQRMAKIPKFLSFITNGKTLPDQFHVFEEPLNPLHISLLSVYFIGKDMYNVEFIEKLTSHPLTRYTVNEFFPNCLSPLDVARQFGFSDIAIIIEKAGGEVGMWADLPKVIEEKSIAALTLLKELTGLGALGDVAKSRVLSMLGINVPDDDGSEFRKKDLEGKPTIDSMYTSDPPLPTLPTVSKDESASSIIHGHSGIPRERVPGTFKMHMPSQPYRVPSKQSAPFNQKTFMEKYRDRFMAYVPAEDVVSNWEVYDIIDENTFDGVKKAPPSDKRSILFRYIRKNGSLHTIRKMSDLLIEIGEHGYPHVKSLGEDMREDLNNYS